MTKSATKAELVAQNIALQNRVIALEGSVRVAQRTIEQRDETIESLSKKLKLNIAIGNNATKALSVTRQQMLAARDEAMRSGKVVRVALGG